LPAGEIGSGRRHAHCLVTPRKRCSRWGGLSSRIDDRAPGGCHASSTVAPCHESPVDP
jgi:hypothetical protein